MVRPKAPRKGTKGTRPAGMSAYNFMMVAGLPHQVVLFCSHYTASPSVPGALSVNDSDNPTPTVLSQGLNASIDL